MSVAVICDCQTDGLMTFWSGTYMDFCYNTAACVDPLLVHSQGIWHSEAFYESSKITGKKQKKNLRKELHSCQQK